MKINLIMMLAAAAMLTGCVTTDDTGKKKVSYTQNMQQATWRSGGDLAMTALLDSGADSEEAVKYVNAVIAFLEEGDTTKELFRVKVLALAPFGYSDYVDALIAVVPSSVSWNEKIPANIRTGLVSFLKDGALHGASLYKKQ
jgi:hypothetical protein